MRRRYRYGIFIASAILACAPLAMNSNVVKADVQQAQGTSSASNTAQGSTGGVQQGTTTKNSDLQQGTDDAQPKKQVTPVETSTQQGDQQKQGVAGVKGTASGNPIVAQAKVVQQRSISGDTNKDRQKNIDQTQHQGTQVDPHQVKTDYDKKNLDPQTRIPLHAVGLTEYDAVDYITKNFGNHIHIYVDGKEIDHNLVPLVKDKDGHSVAYIEGFNNRYHLSMKLEKGDVIQVVAVPKELTPNKWYSWTPVDNQFGKGDPIGNAETFMDGKLPDPITDRVADDTKTSGEISEQTDDYGNLPRIQSNKKLDGKYTVIELGGDRFTPTFEFEVSDDAKNFVPLTLKSFGMDRNWRDGELVPDPNDPSYHENQSSDNITINGEPEKPNDTVTFKPITITDNPDSKDKKKWDNGDDIKQGPDFDLNAAPTTEITTTDTQNTVEESNQNNEAVTKPTNSKFIPINKQISSKINLNKLIFVRNAFIYDENGHVVQEDGAYQIKIQGQKVKILDNGRVYTFDGQEYYKIDSGNPDHPYYVRTSSVGNAPKKQAVVMRGTLKKYRINVYSKNGKVIGTWKKANKVKFDKKMYKKGHTYYRIQGTKYWVRSTSVNFVKKQAKTNKNK